ARVIEQPAPISLVVSCDQLYVEPAISQTEGPALSQDSRPGQSSLIDFQHEPLEQNGIRAHWKAVLLVVVRPVQRVSGGEFAVRSHSQPDSARRASANIELR